MFKLGVLVVMLFWLETSILRAEKKTFLTGSGQMANSSKECAICHIRWIKSLDPSTGKNETESVNVERQAGSSDMCLSCHDGSVVDSRFKVWSTNSHVTGSAPSNRVQIPKEIFPLDEKGLLTCATCHTAHAIKDNSDIESVIFLRQPNINSSLCLKCHTSFGSDKPSHHPLGKIDFKVPEEILSSGGITNTGKNELYCQTCHAPHGAENPKMLLLPVNTLCTSCHSRQAEEVSDTSSRVLHRMGQLNELTCLSCHQMHSPQNKKQPFFLRSPKADLCSECHPDKQKIFGGEHDPANIKWKGKPLVSKGNGCADCHTVHRNKPSREANKDSIHTLAEKISCQTCHKEKGPGKQAATIHVEKKLKDVTTPLPLGKGSNKGAILCSSCHEIHQSAKGSKLLRASRDSSQLCMSCHIEKKSAIGSRHDLRISSPEKSNNAGEKAFVSGPCSQCHLIHTPENALVNWAVTPKNDSNMEKGVCLSCHEKITVKTEKDSSFHGGIEKAKSCSQCHATHAGELPKFLKEPSAKACFECHDEEIVRAGEDTIPNLKKEILEGKSKHEPVEKGKCQLCHKGHRSGNPKLLTKKYPILDYVSFSLENYSLCFQDCHKPKMLLNKMDTATNFRDGNVNLHFIHVNQKKSRTCKLCHSPHASQSPFLIQKNVQFGPRGWKMNLEYTLKKNGGSCTSSCHKEKTYDRINQQNEFKEKNKRAK